MDIRAVLMVALKTPRRFLDWVYEPAPWSGPSRGQAVVHLRTGASGQDSSRWMAIEEAERRERVTALRRLR